MGLLLLDDEFLTQSIIPGLQLLADGLRYAEALNSSPWEFAVGVRELRAAGCTDNDLRFLVVQGYVECAVEVPGQKRRRFGKQKNHLLNGNTCLVLTSLGMDLVVEVGAGSRNGAYQGKRADAALHPRFMRRVLWAGTKVVKKFRQPAESQETILLAFEELYWDHEMDDPLSPSPDIDAKQRLRQTIANLNRHQINPLIHFFGNGTGEKVGWEWKV